MTREEVYKQRNRSLLMYTTAVIFVVGGMSYAAVPLYRVFCAATGFAGTPQVAGAGKFAAERLVPVEAARRIKVVFNADTSEALPWRFAPQQKFVSVLPGETSLAFYKAHNTSDRDVIGIATYNVTPDRVAPYFAKVECFCFEEQKLLAGEEVDMPLLFFIDKDILDDPACKGVDNIVLSYTFFKARRNERGHLEPDAAEDVVQNSLGEMHLSPSSSANDKSGTRRKLTRANSGSFSNSTSTNMATHSSRPSSLFANFSFRHRSNSGQRLQPLPPVRESTGSGGTDEFGAASQPRGARTTPPASMASAATSTATSTPAPRTSMALLDNPPSPEQPSPPPPRSPPQPAPKPQLHPEIRSIVQLAAAHAHKVYFSGPFVKHVERHTDGKVVGKEEPWREVWGQLGGTTLSVWDMKEIEEASKRGAEVPPTYLNITDACIHVLGAVTMPGPDGTPVKYSNVVTLTTAGLNLMLFSCPTPQALVSWTAALRLAAYEKSRLEELYTAHLLRMSLSEQGVWKDPRSPLVNGRLEGWVKIRINGQTDWKRLWMCAQANRSPEASGGSGGDTVSRKNRMSTLFGRSSHEPSNSLSSITTDASVAMSTRSPCIALYTSPKPRDRKKPVLTLGSITQVFAVYPERPELISRSTLIKTEGFIGDDDLAGEWRSREGWLLMMPEAEQGKLGSLEMLKWLVGLHDVFCLYGRPTAYTWNPREPHSLMFAYPVGPRKDQLFLDRELAERVDPREDRGSVVRQRFKDILIERMYGQEASRMSLSLPHVPDMSPANGSGFGSSGPPSLPAIQGVSEQQQRSLSPQQNGGFSLPQLPPLSFDSASQPAPGSLSPITERTQEDYNSRASTQDHARAAPGPSGSGGSAAAVSSSSRAGPVQSAIEEEGILGGQRVESPLGNVPSYDDPQHQQNQQQSQPAGFSSPRSPAQNAQNARGFSQDSVSGSQGLLTSPARGLRSPPISPQTTESSSKYSSPSVSNDPANVQLPTSGAQTPASERQTSLPMSVDLRRPLSPASARGAQHEQEPLSPMSHVSHATMMTSPFSIKDGASAQASVSASASWSHDEPPPAPPAKTAGAWEPAYKPRTREAEYIFDEPGALYYVQQQRQEDASVAPRRAPIDGDSDDSEPESEHSVLTNPMSVNGVGSPQKASSPVHQQQARVPGAPQRRSTPMGFEHLTNVSAASGSVGSGRSGSLDTNSITSGGGGGGNGDHQLGGPRAPLTRRPSGARAPPRVAGKRFIPSDSPSSMPREVDEQQPPVQNAHTMSAHNQHHGGDNDDDDETVDALAALSFLEQHDDDGVPAPAQSPRPTRQQQNSPLSPSESAYAPMPAPPQIMEPEDRAPSPPSPRSSKHQYRSSFAPSKQAAERKARSQAQQAAHDAAVHKPGRPNGRQKTKQREGGWESSEDEEEEEEEDEDEEEDAGEEEEQPRAASANRGATIAAPVGRNPVYQQQMRGLSPSASGSAVDVREQQNQQRAVRTLPQIPRGRSPAGSDRRYTSDQYDGPRDPSIGRPQTQYSQQQYQQPQFQPQANANRQTMWSSVLNAGRDPAMPAQQGNVRDTFVQMESPAETMTKAFTPQGLLSAGLQDKEDRSAKRQEELARETGASLINVPNKPPPPQMGLLGAISAHERERKREGGVGAALTEREREKRMAEDRQRRLDELQRQQLEQQQQMAAQFGGGGMNMYGGGLTPQMTGMNPMMTGYGYPPMNPQLMGGPQSMYFNPMFNPMMANPQHMYAAQQAAQAYQQAMVAMSSAGSQVGGEGAGGGGPGGGSPSQAAMMGGNMGYDPRMSMMSMGMMGPMGSPLGMGMMGMPGMGSPMGMQMTGGSGPMGPAQGGMDPRFSLGPGAFDGLSVPPGGGQGSGQQSQRVSSYNGSPAGTPAPPPGPHNARGDAEPTPRE
ncbi:hypothetical protein DFH11DRAFT_1850703 [Phellopilus nigrolimitatus]|nr:hypothetical protein DFH11DRAFT_1850703 [Phellopilus nigrolimitatus]